MAPTVKRARTSRKLARTARERRAHGSDQEDGRDLWDSREDAGEGRMPDGGKRGVKRSSPGRAGDASEEGVSIIPLLLLPPSQKAILMAIIVQFSLISAQMIFRKEEEKRAQLVNILEMPEDVYDVPPLWMSLQR
ncbi:uncharacterized protein LOC100934306 [Sarcophilus harrisii]|uniref:uncharacterized protein LOC100934306 n=1 Tax=Sarcophilus harrisii TaxID=9305 RepID=UPI001301EAA8|nr:uncharacterized protein LOC100934306 [Sarcophilus harrisii]